MAAALGLPGVIAHGMLTMASAARVVTDWLDDPADLVEYGVRFTKPVVVPDDDKGATVTFSAKVDKVTDGLAEIDITALAGEEKVLGRARAVVRVREVPHVSAGRLTTLRIGGPADQPDRGRPPRKI